MRQRVVSGLLAASVLAGTLGAGAAQAAALSAEAPRRAVAAQSADAPPGWIIRGKYWTRGGCLEAGQDGVQRRHWDEFQCADGILQWVLWTNR